MAFSVLNKGYWLNATSLLLLIGLLALSSVALGQLPPGATPAQIQAFQSLPPAQQQQILQSIPGADPAAMGASAPLPGRGEASRLPERGLDRLDPQWMLLDSDTDLPISRFERDEQAIPSERSDLRRRLLAGLSPFGYSLFASAPTTFAPVTNIPVPREYVLGIGDSIRINIWGSQTRQWELEVDREGRIDIPGIGPMMVAGLTFEHMRDELQALINRTFIGVQSTVGLGQLRSIRVFILGEANQPGAYDVSSLSTLTNALLVSGGVSTTGSLRAVRLMRDGQMVAELDLYDLLLRGDTSADRRLLPGDVIFIPPVGPVAAIRGQVRRPALYELKSGETIEDLIGMAGGLRPIASPRFTQLFRIVDRLDQTVFDVDLTSSRALSQSLRDGDILRIGTVDELREGYVTVSGAVRSPGSYRWEPDLTVSTLLGNLNLGFRKDADFGYAEVDFAYALILRKRDFRGNIDVIQFDLGQAMQFPGSLHDPALQDLDQLLIFPNHDDAPETVVRDGSPERVTREELLAPVLQRLERQAGSGDIARIVSVQGEVRFPGNYPLPLGGEVHQIIAAAGGLRDSAFGGEADLIRFELQPDGRVERELVTLDLDLALGQPDQVALRLQSRDRLLVKRIPDFLQNEFVTLEGEVRFPGRYSIREGETLSQIVSRAGGLREGANIRGAFFSRENLRVQEAANREEAQQRLNRGLLDLLLGQQIGQSVDVNLISQIQRILPELEDSEPVGRLVINLEGILDGRAEDLLLRDGDLLRIPSQFQSVTVFGEVQFPTSHLFSTRLTIEDYIQASGGPTAQADRRAAYVIRADGSVWSRSRSAWFQGAETAIQPGDTIVLPLKLDRVDQLTLWTNVSQILYQISLGAAAVRTFQ